jgi:hypothetical protein
MRSSPSPLHPRPSGTSLGPESVSALAWLVGPTRPPSDAAGDIPSRMHGTACSHCPTPDLRSFSPSSSEPRQAHHQRHSQQACRRRDEVSEVFHSPLLELVFAAASVHRMHNDPSMVRRQLPHALLHPMQSMHAAPGCGAQPVPPQRASALRTVCPARAVNGTAKATKPPAQTQWWLMARPSVVTLCAAGCMRPRRFLRLPDGSRGALG